MKTTLMLAVLLALTAGAVEAEAVTLRAVSMLAGSAQLRWYLEHPAQMLKSGNKSQVTINYVGEPADLP